MYTSNLTIRLETEKDYRAVEKLTREAFSSKIVKDIMLSLGADLCGIASIDRFEDAPKGFHPLDVLPTCKSVISFGCRFPIGTLV